MCTPQGQTAKDRAGPVRDGGAPGVRLSGGLRLPYLPDFLDAAMARQTLARRRHARGAFIVKPVLHPDVDIAEPHCFVLPFTCRVHGA